MTWIEVVSEVAIDAPVDRVRAQFGDVAHHELAAVHRGVRFEVISDDANSCRYRQITQVGPLRLRQEFVLDRSAFGPLVNRVVKGQLAGGAISFDIADDGTAGSRVTATVRGPLGWQRPLAPVLRRKMQRALAAALAEDKADIESGNYV